MKLDYLTPRVEQQCRVLLKFTEEWRPAPPMMPLVVKQLVNGGLVEVQRSPVPLKRVGARGAPPLKVYRLTATGSQRAAILRRLLTYEDNC